MDLSVAAGSLLVLTGPTGSGRTALLLTLTGRMRPGEGRLRVAGLPLPAKAHAVQRLSALAEMPEVNPLEDNLSIDDHVREHLALSLPPFWHHISADQRQRADAVLARVADAAGYERSDSRTLVKELPALERFGLGVALALLDGPRLLAVDDVDALRDPDDQRAAWGLLRRLAAEGTTVIATCVDSRALDPAEDVQVVRLTP